MFTTDALNAPANNICRAYDSGPFSSLGVHAWETEDDQISEPPSGGLA